MKNIKIIAFFVILAALTGFWIIGCTGEGVYDTEPQPTGQPTIPTPSPTGTGSPAPTPAPTPGQETLTKVATGRANSFDIELYSSQTGAGTHVYWVEKSTTPSGSAFRILKDGSGSVAQIITGLNLPSALKVFAGEERGGKETKDYMIVSESGAPTNGILYRINLSDSSFPVTQLTSGLVGDIIYLSMSGGIIFFTRDAGGSNSAIHVVDTFPQNVPAIPDSLDSNVTNAYDVKAFTIQESTGSGSECFVLATERIAAPDGRVLIYDVTDNPTLPVAPVEVSSSEAFPTRVVFQPLYESDNATPKFPMEGHVYWTNYDASSGGLIRQKIKYNTSTKAVELDGVREIVAQSLKYPYSVHVPHNMASGSLMGTLNKVIVSSNRSQVDGGNFYVIDVSDSSKFPLTPSDSEVTDLISETVAYPLNAEISYSTNSITMYFTSYNDVTGGNNDGIIYYFSKGL